MRLTEARLTAYRNQTYCRTARRQAERLTKPAFGLRQAARVAKQHGRLFLENRVFRLETSFYSPYARVRARLAL